MTITAYSRLIHHAFARSQVAVHYVIGVIVKQKSEDFASMGKGMQNTFAQVSLLLG